MLGFEKHGARLRLDPCIPAAWPGFTLDYRYGASSYAIDVRNPHSVSRGVTALSIDGAETNDGWIPLADDGSRHVVTVVLGRVP